jgi:YHS domain-containing protein
MEFLPAVSPPSSRNRPILHDFALARGLPTEGLSSGTRRLLMALDPVCMMEITPDSAEAQLVYEGETIYFCCDECKRIFDADPETFLDEIEPVGDAAGRDS